MTCNQRLKILCLHGYRQDSEVFKEKIGSFRKNVKNIADLVFIDSPHLVPNTENEASPQRPGRGWWFSTESNTFKATQETRIAKGFQESVDSIKEAFQNQGPFHGILGFSQGATMASLICGLAELKEFPYEVRFVILISGFKSLSKCHDHIYQKVITSHSLHIIGCSDQCIPEDLSKNLVAAFLAPRISYHDGGHYLPTQSSIRNDYIAFLKLMLTKF